MLACAGVRRGPQALRASGLHWQMPRHAYSMEPPGVHQGSLVVGQQSHLLSDVPFRSPPVHIEYRPLWLRRPNFLSFLRASGTRMPCRSKVRSGSISPRLSERSTWLETLSVQRPRPAHRRAGKSTGGPYLREISSSSSAMESSSFVRSELSSNLNASGLT